MHFTVNFSLSSFNNVWAPPAPFLLMHLSSAAVFPSQNVKEHMLCLPHHSDWSPACSVPFTQHPFGSFRLTPDSGYGQNSVLASICRLLWKPWSRLLKGYRLLMLPLFANSVFTAMHLDCSVIFQDKVLSLLHMLIMRFQSISAMIISRSKTWLQRGLKVDWKWVI